MARPKADEVSQSRPFRPTHVAVLGGGVAGHLAALALKEWRPELEVTIIGARDTTPGLALSSTPSLVAFLLGYLGLDAVRFERQVAPTFKLGTRFEWGRAAPAWFNNAYGDGDLVDAQTHDGDTLRYGMSSQLMSAGKGLFASLGGPVIPLLKETRFAWHLDLGRLVAFLVDRARHVGVERIDAALTDVETRDGNIGRALTSDGRTLSYDLWVDTSDPATSRIAKALNVPSVSYDGSIFTNRMLSAVRPGSGAPPPYTTATTLSAGWGWEIPLRDEDSVGYVYSSRFLSEDAAAAELAERFPGARVVGSRSCTAARRRDFIAGNTVALGEAYGMIDPLAASALPMTLVAIMRLIGLLAGGGQDARRVDGQVAADWDALRWYLALHFRLNRRLDTPFWREVQLTTDWSGLEDTVRDFLAHGPLSQRPSPRADALREGPYAARDLDLALLGQGVIPQRLAPVTTGAEWQELMAMRAAVVACTLPQHETWSLHADPSLWTEVVHDERSWCRQMALEMHRAAPSRGRSQEALAFWTRELGVPAMLGRDAAKLPDEFPASPNIDFGKFLKKVPEVVLRPKDQAQLAQCLQMCARRRMPMRVRGAGHSSGGQTLADEGAVIDLRWLKRIISQGGQGTHGAEGADEHRIRVESGLWWLELCGHLRAQGRRPLVLTANWRSTVGGTLAVGGFGDSTHREGLQIAGVRELTVMTIDGTRHRVRPGDDLFDWSLAGRGQLGVITEVVLETTDRSYSLEARVLTWPTLERFLADARVIVAEGRFDWLRARLSWAAGIPVAAAAGHLSGGSTRAGDFAGLGAHLGASERVDLYDKSAEPPDERWELASPGVEVILPVDASGIAALHEMTRRVASSELARYLSRGSSLVVLPGRDAVRFPMAPLPASELVMQVAMRPKLPLTEVARHLPLLRGIADLALDAGGKVYLMSLEPTRPGWLQQQLGAERYRHLVALKSKWDPDSLLNPGLL